MKTKNTNKAVKMLIALIVCFIGVFVANKVNAAAVTTDVIDANGYTVTWEYEANSGKAEKVRIKQVKNPGGEVIVPVEKEERYSLTNGYGYYCRHEYSKVIIPSTLDGNTVVSIGDGTNRIINPDISKMVFEDGIEYVTIPDTVEKINANAFENCIALIKVTFGNSVKEIGNYAFRNCIMLGGVAGAQELPESLETIGNYAFEINALGHYSISSENGKSVAVSTKLSEVPLVATNYDWGYYFGGKYVLNDNIKTIGDFAFAGNNQIKDITIPETTTSIGKGAFLCCHNVENITINTPASGSLTIKDFAFGYQTTSLEEVTIPSGVTLGKYVFGGDKNLTTVNLQNGVTVLPEGTFSECEKLTTVNRTENFTNIGNHAFDGCKAITLEIFYDLTTGTTTLGDYAFANCSGIEGAFTLPTGITSVGNGIIAGTDITSYELVGNYTELPAELFKNCSKLRTIIKPSTVTKIGDSCFYGCDSLTVEELQSNILQNIEIIGNSAFESCQGLVGTLQLIPGIKTIGSKAFYGCKNITNVVFNDDLTTIGDEAFAEINLPEVMRFPESVIKVGRNAFSTIREAFFGAEGVTFNGRWYKSRDVITHFKNCKHKVSVINSLPGVRVINTATNEDFVTGEYDCESTITLKIIIEDESLYPDFAVRMSKCGQYASSPVVKEFLTLNAEKTITIDSLTRDTEIRLQKSEDETDLVLREFITEVNGEDVAQNRNPYVSTKKQVTNLEPIEYQHTKYPVYVEKDDAVTYSLRIYNEDDKAGIVNKVNVYLQDGLELDTTNTTNTEYGWEVKETSNLGTIITTDYLKNKNVKAYSGEGRPDFEELQFVCKVTKDDYKTLTNIAEIVESSDVDSIGGNVTVTQVLNYKKEESYTSTEESFIQSAEDDTDYEMVELKEYAKVGYTISVQKIDSTDLELLNGAKFNLYNENGELLESKKTVQNGKLEFSERISYGEGVETYYIEEVEVPAGYKKTIDGRLMLVVEKEIDELGKLRIKITCEANEITDYDENMEFIPITTAEQLAKIGSGEQVAIGGKTYEFAEDANYILNSDIDISANNWTPIKITNGIFEGNNHKIIGLKIENLTAETVGYTGLFSEFSGIIRNLELSDISITGNEVSVNYRDTSEIAAGGLVGYMTEGKISNVTVTGNIDLPKLKNIGGFIGHTGEGKVIKITDCTFNGTIDGDQNVGGIVGVAKENVELVSCNSKGLLKVENIQGNVAGLIAVAKPTGDSMDNIIVEYDEANSKINIAVKNKKTTGKYEVVLHKIEKLGNDCYVLDGAEFTIYDENMQVLTHNGQQLENVVAVNGKIEIADNIINSLESDVFYIKETNAPEGYDKINELVKIVITKKWNSEQGKYEIDLVPSVVTGKTDTPASDDNTNSGVTYQPVNEEYMVKKLNRIKVSNCVNEATIQAAEHLHDSGIIGDSVYAVGKSIGAGMVAVSYGNVSFYDSVNKGKVEADYAAGLIAQVGGNNSNYDSIRIIRCSNGVENSTDENCGTIIGRDGSGYEASGIIGKTYIDTTIEETNNYANITGNKHIGGIIASTYSRKTNIYDSGNYGKLEHSGNYEGNIGGIVGTKLDFASGDHYVLDERCYFSTEPFEINILNCTSKGDISGIYHIAGILGGIYTQSNDNTSNKINISDCIVGSDNENEKMQIFHELKNGGNTSMAGILGYGYANSIRLNNNIVKNIELKSDYLSGIFGGVRMEVAGVAGHIYSPSTQILYELEVKNNIVENLKIDSSFETNGFRAGLVAKIVPYTNEYNICNCIISDNKVINSEITGKDDTGFGGNAGLLGSCGGNSTINSTYTDLQVLNCDVINTDINIQETRSYDAQTGGLIAITACEKVRIENCNVISTDDEKHLIKYSDDNDCQYSPVGGLVGAFAECGDILIKNCKVKNMEIESGKQYSNSAVGGVVGQTFNGRAAITFNNVEVNNVDINVPNLITQTNGVLGGFIGYSYNGLNVQDSKLANVNINGAGRLVGGIAGLCYNRNSTLNTTTIKNTEVSNLNINSICGYPSTIYGGFIGHSQSEILLSDNKIDGISIAVSNLAATAMGGLVGNAEKNITIQNNTANNIKLKNEADTWTSTTPVTLGGFAGNALGTNNTINNNKVDNLEIETFVANIGGLVAYGKGQLDADENELSNIKFVANNKINDPRSYNGFGFGGLVGVNEQNYEDNSTEPTTTGLIKLNANNNKIDKLQVVINPNMPKVHVGGFMGVGGDASVINDNTDNAVTVNDFEVKNESKEGIVGGILGVVIEDSHAVLKNVKVANMEAEGNYAIGGIIGCGLATIESSTVTNMDTTFDEENIPEYKQSIVGGIAGIATETSEISNVEVNADENTTHELKSSYFAGGIAGICSGKMQNAIAKNIIVHTLAEKPEEPEVIDEDAEPTIVNAIEQARAIVVQHLQELINCRAENVTVINGSSSTIVNE